MSSWILVGIPILLKKRSMASIPFRAVASGLVKSLATCITLTAKRTNLLTLFGNT